MNGGNDEIGDYVTVHDDTNGYDQFQDWKAGDVELGSNAVSGREVKSRARYPEPRRARSVSPRVADESIRSDIM